MPWWHGHFEPAPPFESVRPLFDELARSVDAKEDPAAMSEAFQAVVQLGLSIDRGSKEPPLTEFFLYIKADRFRLRY
ncbi:hypothetical protein [Streptacidiphilus sp. EB129]|uniref:hypothetical protein n=1 Tax=Streptacidiphilus sp. EB129 TaxID=3156262 RepID=UPI003514ED15